MWVRADGAFEPLVAPELFIAAQDRIASRSDRLSDDEMLPLLRATFDDRGYLSGLIIDESERLPSSIAYRTRFVTLLRAYHLFGFSPEPYYNYVEITKYLRQMQ